ncbi:MAG: hypothetical protein NT016_01095 [Candidatus Aenigmarchaeota archaeon]|nr:hypothetical protein [Candidatus Aenigmarchaeota archaeon]
MPGKRVAGAEARSFGRKAQFLIITAVVIVSIFYLVSKWMQPYSIPDASEIVLSEQPFVFNNVKEKALEVVATSSSCSELVDNLDEFKTYVDTFAFKKMIVYFDYTLNTPCYSYDPRFPILVLFNIRIQSIGMTVSDRFYGFWPPGSGP